MKVLVTGGSGFIGSQVVSSLIRRGFNVVNFDIAPPGSHPDMWIEGDILDTAKLDAVFAHIEPDAVIHLAAKADVESRIWSDFASIHAGTARLLAAIDRTPRVQRLVNISTQLVNAPYSDASTRADFRPSTTYGEAKAHAETLLLHWNTQAAWLTVRPANIWGPRHPHFPQGLWSHVRRRSYLHPSGRPVFRSYGYVGNLAEQIVALLICDPARTNRRIFYGGDSVMDSALWVDAFARALTGRPARRAPVAILKAMGIAGDFMRLAGVRPPLDSARVARMTTGYPVPLEPTLALTGPPAISLEDGVAETVQWLRAGASE